MAIKKIEESVANSQKKYASKLATSSQTAASASKSSGRTTTKTGSKKTSPKEGSILQSVHETAMGLHSIGAISQTTMREFDALCLPEVPTFSSKEIKAIRSRCQVSQAVFANFMNITPSSLQKWETGAKKPSNVAMKLLDLVNRKGLDVLV
ncbi:MAG: DNA-binding transcriptional regulator [Candidatus Melainabacteria bacterium]|nr:DNA-binding transcriptional regulator [Candidatus Melainabacteria bacterium]